MEGRLLRGPAVRDERFGNREAVPDCAALHPLFFVNSIASSSVAAVTTAFTSSPLSSMMQLTR
jgi:hypothetical protein